MRISLSFFTGFDSDNFGWKDLYKLLSFGQGDGRFLHILNKHLESSSFKAGKNLDFIIRPLFPEGFIHDGDDFII